jgi:hypothetical protein
MERLGQSFTEKRQSGKNFIGLVLKLSSSTWALHLPIYLILRALHENVEIFFQVAHFVPLSRARFKSIWRKLMRFRTALCLASLFLVCFTVAAWSSPVPDRLVPNNLQPVPDNQSLSGKISSVGDAQFSIDVLKDKDVNTVQFMVDEGTKVEGKLSVGAQATVEYRSDAGKNIAVRVIVTPASGLNLL